MEKVKSTREIYAYWTFFNSPSWFFTLAPTDIDGPLVTLHFHAVINAGIPVDVVSSLCHEVNFRETIIKVISSMIMAHIPEEYHDEADKQGTNPFRGGLQADYKLPTPQENNENFENRAYQIVAAVNRHTIHCASCHKGEAGKLGCRMGMPQPFVALTDLVELRAKKKEPPPLSHKFSSSKKTSRKRPSTQWEVSAKEEISPKPRRDATTPFLELPLEIKDNRMLYLDLYRKEGTKDNLVVPASLPVAVACHSNQAIYHLAASGQARPVMFYLVKYITKDKTKLTNCLSCIFSAREDVKTYSDSDPASDAADEPSFGR